MNKTISFLVFFIFLLALPVFAIGTCELDKETYHPGETSLFDCFCTLGNEKNVEGFMVWRNSSHVLRNVSTNSNDCIGSFFTDSHTFSAGDAFTGNVTFVTTDASWANVGDVVTDTFLVNGSGVNDCILTELQGREVSPGETGIIKGHVLDGVTSNGIVESQCFLSLYDTNDTVIHYFGDRITGLRYVTSLEGGEFYFSQPLEEEFWLTNTTYIAEIQCTCVDTINNRKCSMEPDGTAAVFRSCKTKFPIVTGNSDLRTGTQGWALPLLMGFFAFTLMLYWISFKLDERHAPMKVLFFFMGLFSTVGFLFFLNEMARLMIPTQSGVLSVLARYYGAFTMLLWPILAYFIILYFIFGVVIKGIKWNNKRKKDMEEDFDTQL